MTIQQSKVAVWVLLGAILCLLIAVFSMNRIMKTYKSALDNTVDSSIIKIIECKIIFKEECKKIGRNLPNRFVVDGTCGVE